MEVTEKELNCSGVRVHGGVEESGARREVCKLSPALSDGSAKEKQVTKLRLGPSLAENSRSPGTILHVYHPEMEIKTRTAPCRGGEREILSPCDGGVKAYFNAPEFSLFVDRKPSSRRVTSSFRFLSARCWLAADF